MKSYRKELWFNTKNRRDYINITPQIEKALIESGIREGMILCNAMHITSSVFINDDEGGLLNDFEGWLEGLAPEKPYDSYRHNDTGEDNADAHLKRSIMGREAVIAVTVTGNLISDLGNRYFTGSLTAEERKGYCSKLSVSDLFPCLINGLLKSDNVLHSFTG